MNRFKNQIRIKIGLLSLCVGVGSVSHALPILRETAGEFSETLVTIYPDHKDPKLFYFLPNKVNFAKQQNRDLPQFSMNSVGAEQDDLSKIIGMVSFTFQPALTPEVQAELKAFLKRKPGAVLAPLPVGESYLEFGTNRQGIPQLGATDFFKSFDLPSFGGVLESQVGGNGYLTPMGTKVMYNALKQGRELSMNLNLCYGIDGVSPQMDALVEIQYDKVFSHFKGRASGGWWIFGGSVAKEVQKLIEEGHITIRLRGDTKFEDMVMEMARELAKEYLHPVLPNGQADDRVSNQPFRLIRFGFGSVRVEERRKVTLNIQKQVDVKDVRCLAAPTSDLSRYFDKLVYNLEISSGIAGN